MAGKTCLYRPALDHSPKPRGRYGPVPVPLLASSTWKQHHIGLRPQPHRVEPLQHQLNSADSLVDTRGDELCIPFTVRLRPFEGNRETRLVRRPDHI